MKMLFSIEKINIEGLLIFFLFATIVLLVLYVIVKIRTISYLQYENKRLKDSIEKLDSQAKIILKSDLELKFYQEEIEDKINKLTLLKNIILTTSLITDKEQLFSQINEGFLNDFGFKKGLILNFDDFSAKINIGLAEYLVEKLIPILQNKKEVFKTIFLLPEHSQINEDIRKIIMTKNILIAPIRTKGKIYAIFLVADYFLSDEITETEKAIFMILCSHLGLCLDNIQLYEDLYHTKDELELKIKERTNELAKSLREIELINKAKSDFISSVSHELRTPLTSIKGFAALLIEEKFGKLPQEAKERLIKIDENINKLVDMVNTLLDISRIESGKVEIKIAPSDIVKLMKDTVDFLLPQINAKNIKLEIESPDFLNVYMDKNLIERVFINLINNAIKFTPQNGQIKITCKKELNKAIISIKDNGCGISKENLDKIFKEFFREDNPINREIKGSGLGLALVKQIIDIHKEKIWVESELNKGTVFYFTLKLA